MATVVRLPPDRRAELLGAGLGALGAAVLASRQKKKEEEEKQSALKQSLDLFGRGLRGGTKTRQVPRRERSRAALEAGGGPTKKAAGIMDQLPTEQETPITGRDVAEPLINAGFDEQFAFTLAKGIEEARTVREQEATQSAAIEQALTAAAQEGAKRTDVIAGITSSEHLTPDQKISLLNNLDRIIPKDEDDEDFTIELFTPEGESVKVPVPERVAKNAELRETFAATNFPGYSVKPIPKPEKLSGKKADVAFYMDMGYTRDEAMNLATDRFRVTGPDQGGRFAIFDRATQATKFVGGGNLTESSLRILERRIFALDDAIQLLDRADTSKVGIDKILAAEVGGIALQIPVLGAVAQALGLTEDEVAEIQAARGGFFSTLGPILASFDTDGNRRSIATRAELDIAKRMLNMTRWASTPGGAELARNQMVDVLKDIRARLIAQRQSRSIVAPEILKPTYDLDESGKVHGTVPKEEQ